MFKKTSLVMTQLGGFDTVTANTWWFVFTKDQPSWAAMRGSVLRLKGIYRHYLLHYEREHFRGKRRAVFQCRQNNGNPRCRKFLILNDNKVWVF